VREPLILAVAGQVFAQDGYERASMDRIAARADLSKPMLYAYFGSKEGLYSAYIELTGGELVERLVAADRAADHTDRIRAVTAEFLAFVSEQGDGWRVLFAEMNANRPLVEIVAQLRTRIIGEVRMMLEARVRRRCRRDRRGRRVAGQLVDHPPRGHPRGRHRLVRGPGPGSHHRGGAQPPVEHRSVEQMLEPDHR